MVHTPGPQGMLLVISSCAGTVPSWMLRMVLVQDCTQGTFTTDDIIQSEIIYIE